MLKKIRKKIIQKALLKVFICIAIIVGILFFSDMAPVKMIQGTKKAYIDKQNIESYYNQYISLDIKYMNVEYAEEETTKKSKVGTTISKKITAKYYVAANEYSEYFSVYANKLAMDEVDEHLYSSTNGVEPVTYKGSFVKLSDLEYSHLKSFMTEAGLAEDEYSQYVFKVNYVGKCDEITVYMLMIAIVAVLLYALLSFITGFSNRYARDVKKFATNNGITFDQLSLELDNAYEINGVWITSSYTAYLKGNKVKMLKNQNYIWAYYKETRTTRKGVTNYTRQVALADRNKKFKYITIKTEDDARKIIGMYSETQPQMVLGYNEDLQNLFKNNFDQFLLLPYQTNVSNDETAPSEEFIPEEYVPESYTPEDSSNEKKSF
ncbi:DUF6709 family protein [Anaerosporobacter sp.]